MAGVLVPWTVYVMFGDRRILADNYASMTHYMDWLAAQGNEEYRYNGAGTGMETGWRMKRRTHAM